MKIGGFQPLTLLDFPGKVAAIVFTQGCLFRCDYCHNPDLIPRNVAGSYDEAEILSLLERRSTILDGVCITGGEPTIQPDLLDFMAQIKALGLLVKLDTNGWRPEVVRQALERNLVDYIAMDIKAPWSKYEDIIKIPADTIVARCQESLRLIIASGIDHEFRTTVWSAVHTPQDLTEIASYLPPDTYYNLQHVRYDTTLNPSIAQAPPLDLNQIIATIYTQHPSLVLSAR